MSQRSGASVASIGLLGTELLIPVDQMAPNPWNPNVMDDFMFEKELASIRKFGFVNPVIVREVGTDYFQIIDGEHRWKSGKQLGMDAVPSWNLGIIPDDVAKQLTIVLNETRGKSEPIKLSELLADLLSTNTREALLDVLPFSKEALDGLSGLADFDWNQFNEVPAPREQTDTEWVERLYRMPKEAAAVIDAAIGAVRAQEGEDVTDWRALELMAADYLGGTGVESEA